MSSSIHSDKIESQCGLSTGLSAVRATKLINMRRNLILRRSFSRTQIMITNKFEERYGDSAVIERSINWDDEESISVAVAQAVSSATDQAVTEMEPLSWAIDADSLNSLFEPTVNSPRAMGEIKFEYNGCLVRLSAAGQLVVVPPTER